MIDSTPQQRVVAMGVLGGLGIAAMAYEHLAVRGTTPEERGQMALYVASLAGTGALIYLAGVDKKYLLLEDAAAALEQEIDKRW